jgi:hypothetical protein
MSRVAASGWIGSEWRDKTWQLFRKVDWLSMTGVSSEQATLALYSGACAAANLQPPIYFPTPMTTACISGAII